MQVKEVDGKVRLSVCDPNLNIEEKSYTTKEPSRVINKLIELKGDWTLWKEMDHVSLERQGGRTVLYVKFQYGRDIECVLILK